jgi:hypothetical protein
MSFSEMLADIDAIVGEVLGDEGEYRPKAGVSKTCTVILKHEDLLGGEQPAAYAGTRTLAGILRSVAPAPLRGDTIFSSVEGEFRVEETLRSDATRHWILVTPRV